MRRILLIILAVSALLDSPIVSAGLSGNEFAIQYQSPLNGARFVTPQTNIIIRTESRLDPATVDATSSLVATGSISGEHSGKAIISDDGHTLIFIPTTSFAFGETVTVSIPRCLRTMDARNVTPISFMFSISERMPSDVLLDQNTLCCLEGSAPIPPSGLLLRQTEGITRGDTLPPDFPFIQTTLFGTPAPGRIFLSTVVLSGPNPSPYLMILDDFGNPVFYRRMTSSCFDFKLQPNGLLTYNVGSARPFFALDQTYTLVDSFKAGNGYQLTDLHDLKILPNGHALIMAYDPQVVDMSQIVPGGDTAAIVYGAIIQELDQAKNVVFQWRSWDYFQITDAAHEDLTAHVLDPVHPNAIDLDSDGNLLLSSRHMDEITKINRQTGQIIWRWGGRNNQFVFANDSISFSHQHAVRRIENGNVTLFDNGNFRTPQYSRAIEYALDEEYMIATVVWQYRNTPDIYGRALGYVQRLSNGNTVIGWGAAVLTMTEVRPDGSKVFELSFAPGMFSYRAYRFEWNPTSVSHPSPVPLSTFSLFQNYPNPFNPKTEIGYAVSRREHIELRIFDLLGREVVTLVDEVKDPGEYSVTFSAESGSASGGDGSQLTSGVYFYRLRSREFSATKKLVLVH